MIEPEYLKRVKVCVAVFEPTEDDVAKAISLLDEGGSIHFVFEHEGRFKQRVVRYDCKPSPDDASKEWQAWQNAKARAIAGE